MKNSNGMVSKMNDLISEMGMEEEMEKLMESFTDNFMIRGEFTEDLKEALQRSPDSLLDMIWDCIFRKEPEEDLERAQKEKILYDTIQEDLERNILYLDPDKLKLLIRVACGAPIDVMYTTIINEEFVPRGWAFNFVEDRECTVVVMNELMQIIQRLEEPEMQRKLLFSFLVKSVINTCLGLYGVTTQEQFEVLYDKAVSGMDEGEDKFLDQDIAGALDVLKEQELFWREEGYIISPYLQTKEEYQELLREQGRKEYYVPEEGVVEAYVFGNFLEKSPEYEAVHKCLMKELKDSDMAEEMLEEIAGYAIRDGWSIPQVMNFLYEGDVAFDNKKSAHRMLVALSEWLYGIRRWGERGHSRKELGKVNEELQYISVDEKPKGKVAAGKVYPNDPCPCGSGKKYKKCCGR